MFCLAVLPGDLVVGQNCHTKPAEHPESELEPQNETNPLVRLSNDPHHLSIPPAALETEPEQPQSQN